MKALNVSVNVIGEMIALRKMSQVKGFRILREFQFKWKEGESDNRGVKL